MTRPETCSWVFQNAGARWIEAFCFRYMIEEGICPESVNRVAVAEFKGNMLVQRHMDRLGGVERLHEQIYSAVTTKRRESLDMALMHYGLSIPSPLPPVNIGLPLAGFNV
jgi:hypothetical protein